MAGGGAELLEELMYVFPAAITLSNLVEIGSPAETDAVFAVVIAVIRFWSFATDAFPSRAIKAFFCACVTHAGGPLAASTSGNNVSIFVLNKLLWNPSPCLTEIYAAPKIIATAKTYKKGL